MKIERTKNATRNIISGLALKAYTIIVPFVMRTIILYVLGAEYLGLDGLFLSILQVLNLTELGVGMAMVNSMYKPIAEDDADKLCALMRLYKLYYRIIGLVILVIGLLLMPFLPHLISGDLPDGLNLYLLYLMNLGSTVLTYWLFAYKNSLLNAHQRVDVQSKVTICTNTIRYALQILVLCIAKSYYLYLLVSLLSQILQNLLCAAIANKLYPNYKAKGKLPKEEVKALNVKIKDVFTSKVGAVVVNSVDAIVISTFLGLQALAVYQNYYYILTSVIGIITIFYSSCTAGIGNSIIVETAEKNYKDLKKFTLMVAWIAGFCSACFLCLFQPFMKLWVGENLMLNFTAVVLFALYFFIYEINALLNTYKDAAGMWHEDRFRPLVTAFANLAMNLIMVHFWDIYGILLSTVVSMVGIGMPWLLHNLFTVLFKKSELKGYLKTLLFYTGISVIACALTSLVCSFINFGSLLTFFVRLIFCLILPNLLFLAVYKRTEEFKSCVLMLDGITHGKLHLKKLLLDKGDS